MKFPKHNIDIFYLILFVSLFVINIYGRIMLASKAISLPFLCIGAVADASLLTALSMLLRGRWRLLALLFLIATCILIIVNILYLETCFQVVDIHWIVRLILGFLRLPDTHSLIRC